MARYVDAVAIMFVVYAVFQLGIACMVGTIYGGMGGFMVAIGVAENEPEMAMVGGVLVMAMLVMAVMLLLQPILALFAASGIYRRTQLGRILGFVVCALAVLNMPIGTIVGIFGFIVLVDKQAAAEFSEHGREESFT
ncbi:MAG: hypothetical protein KC912_13285 [Proteobacteria bacterium]|nr:hypothetical protein [Pseudomonadota bacterium]